jgi:hypothetical protein
MAYGEPNQRQRFLRVLIEWKQITHANFRLAHLLLNNRISSIVVTTNFDDFLAKALALFGKRHLVCDHPLTVGRINPTEADLQIVHLHGTYWFYDCCNLRAELQDRAQQSQQTTATMASLLDMILWDRSPLVIGYSGWEGDVFMDAFKRRLARPLGSNAYWFCFQRAQVESMPDWLKNNPNIRFVVPRERLVRSSGIDATQTIELGKTRPEGGQQIKPKTTGEDDVPSLPADKVFDRLIRAFNLEAPTLTRDPLEFLATQLDESLPKDEASDKDADIYAIKNVIERVRRAKVRETEEISAAGAESAESSFEELRDALRRADYRNAIKLAIQIPSAGLSVEALKELSEAAWLAATKLNDNSEEEVLAYDLFISISGRLSKLSPAAGPIDPDHVARALFNKGFSLDALNRRDEALTAYNEVVRRYGGALDVGLRELVANALLNKGFCLGELNRPEEELTAYDELFHRFDRASEGKLRVSIAQALVNKGLTLMKLNRHQDELTAYDEVVERYGDSLETELVRPVAAALFNRAITLGALERSAEALAAYDEVVRRYAAMSETGLREVVAQALLNKAFTLRDLDRSEEALATYEEVARLYGDAPEASMVEHVARALAIKGFTLTKLNRIEEGMAVFNQLINRYSNAGEVGLQELVGSAHNAIGFQLIIQAKALRLVRDENSAQEKLKLAHENLTAALKQAPDDPVILGNQAYAMFLSGQKAESEEVLRRAILLGGDKTRREELEDANINRLPEDDEFSEMVRSL